MNLIKNFISFTPVAPRALTNNNPITNTSSSGNIAESVVLTAALRGVCFFPDGKAVYLPKPGQQMIFGRDSGCDSIIEDNEVSRKHARIAEQDGKYYLQDLSSTNGTYLNGKRLEPGKWVEFQPGDLMKLGHKLEVNRSLQDLPEQLPQLQLPQAEQSISIGRAEGNSLQLTWPDTSRQHAVITNHQGSNWIMDKGSSNGTLLNGKKIPSQQWVILPADAKVQFGTAPGAAFATTANPTPQPTTLSRPAVKTLSLQQGQEVLNRAQFAPNPTGIRAQGASDCSQEFLQAQGLQPKTTIELGDKKIHFSEAYSLGHNRAACVGYVEDKDGQVHVRAFYRSNSQGLWRSASHAGFNGWIGKGQGEESTNLPIVLQKLLHNQAQQVKELGKAGADQAFYGSLTFAGHEAPEQLQQQLSPASTIGEFSQQLSDGYGSPQSFHWKNPADQPDFTRPDAQYTFEHPIHGQVTANCYPSQNNEINFMFYRDTHGRSWLAEMEKSKSQLTTWGTRSEPIAHGDLAMPAVEYAQQIPQGFQGAHVNGPYYDASSYVHSLPPVAQYRSNLGLT